VLGEGEDKEGEEYKQNKEDEGTKRRATFSGLGRKERTRRTKKT
jgi:hypothetical protein